MVDVLKLVVSYLTYSDCESLQALQVIKCSEPSECSECSNEWATLARDHVDHHGMVISRAVCRWWMQSKSCKIILRHHISASSASSASSHRNGGVSSYASRLVSVSVRTYPRALRTNVMYFIYGQIIREVYSRRLSNTFKDMVHGLVYGEGADLCGSDTCALFELASFVTKSPGCVWSDALHFIGLLNVFVDMHKPLS